MKSRRPFLRRRALPLFLLGLLLPPGSPAARAQERIPPGTGETLLLHTRTVRDADHVRGLWVTRWEFHTPGEVEALAAEAADAGLTDLFFQVRGQGDAFYRSALEPWGAELTGRLGGDPGWDPLAVAVAAAHARGLRLHAWINTFPMWSGSTPPPETSPRQVLLEHPEWVMTDREGRIQRLGNRFGYVSGAPGNPEVQARVEAVVLDLVDHYQVDGIHFDYIRLPDQDYSYDAVSRVRYLRESVDETYLEWQADQISGMLRRIAERARAARPGLILSAAIVNHYHRAVGIFAQDPVAWTAEGVLDYVVPMAYTPRPGEFADMIHGYREALPASRVVMGINLEEMPGDPGTVADQVRQSLEGTSGHVFFSRRAFQGLLARAALDGDLYAGLERLQGTPLAVAEPDPAALARLLVGVARRLAAVLLLLP
jgi:uncharacterized lipoprotein YddW (UPF0748 family)